MTAQAPPTTRPGSARLNSLRRKQKSRAQRTDALLRAGLSADETERRELHAQVIVLHLDVAEAVAWRYAGRGQDHHDLVQVARLGLVEAVERFDPDRGFFLAFATPTMLGHLKRHFRDHGWYIRPPRTIQERQHEVTLAREDLTHTLHRSPTTEEIAGHLSMTKHHVREAQNIQSCYHPNSLDAGVGDHSTDTSRSYADLLGEDQPELENMDVLLTIGPACRLLPPQDQQMLFLRFYLQCSQEDIGTQLGITQMQVSRRLKRILTQLRTTIGELEAPPTPVEVV